MNADMVEVTPIDYPGAMTALLLAAARGQEIIAFDRGFGDPDQCGGVVLNSIAFSEAQ